MQQIDAQQGAQSSDIEGFRPSIQQAGIWRNAAGASALLRADIDAAVAPAPLRRALEAAVARHEILRTRLQTVPGMQLPVQVIGEQAAFGWREADAAGLAPADAANQESQLIADMGAGVHLPAAPVLAAALIRLAPARWRLLLVAPVANADARSMHLLLQELAAGCRDGAGREAGADPLQYADFAEWQHESQAGPESGPGRAFWSRQIDAALLKARHPFERQGAAAAGFAPARQTRPADARWSDRLLTAAAAMGTTPAAILAVCWSALLQRQLGHSAIVLGWRHDGRNDATRDALGPYAKTLPLLSRQDESRPLKALAQAQDALFAQAQAWQDSFNWSELATPATTPNLPLLFEYDAGRAGAGDWRVAAVDAAAEPFSLALSVAEAGADGAMSLALAYDANGFSAAAADNLLDQLATLVENACTQGGQALLSAGSLSGQQRATLAAVNQTDARIESATLLHQLFEAQAARQPQAIAVEFGTQKLSYGELNQRANRLAHRLRRDGVTPERPVGLYLGRSPEALVGILGILKAGGAYLPLDPGYPAERLAFMLAQTAASVVLTVAGLAGQLPASAARALLLDDAGGYAGCGDDNPLPVNAPDSLAYLIFTSGSTGQPKGVMVSHRNAVHSTTARWQNYTLQCESFLLSSSFSFDSSVAGLFWALSQGGRICLPADAEVQDAAALAGLIETHRASHALMLPSLYSLMLETQAASRLASLRCVIVAGEACLAAVAARHHAACPQAQLYNEYGPTEGTVWSTLYESRIDGDEVGGVLPIGQPIANMKVYVLDNRMSPAPLGMAGEIYIGGAGIVRGYLKRPDLTAERFVPDPFGQPGQRLYRTGDIGRFDAAARLEFLGRTDHQVKIRGFRIELGEIEARLVEHAAVREAAVIARADAGGDMRLVAYVVARGAGADAAQLQQHLKQNLPEHMVPAAFMALDALPLTPNGKLDRAALPEPEQRSSRAYAAPRNEAEAQLAQIWADVLGAERVGLDDDFFELGGHSLIATKLVSRVRSLMAREVPVRAIFQHPRLRDFAGHVAQQASGAALAPIPAAPREQPLPLSFAQQRLWFFDRLHPHSVAYNVPGAVRLRGELDIGALRRSFTELLRRHESLRTTFRFDDGPVQVIAPARSLPLPLLDLAHLRDADTREAELRLLLEAEAQTPFDLARGPLLRAGLIGLGAQEHVLWLTLHHIVSDGWSMQVLVRELTSLYEAYSRQQPSPLAEPLTQYADFAAWQRQPRQADSLRRQLDYWTAQLGPAQAPLHLPGSRPRPALQSHRGAACQFRIDKAQLARLNTICEDQGATLFMVLLAAFNVLLAARSGQRDIRVGVPVANRNRLELEDLIGFFVNTLVLRGEVAGELSFAAFLHKVRETVLAAQANQDLPFEQLVDALQPQRDPSRSPLFQVMFDVHRGSILGAGGFGALAMESVPAAPSRSALFDLMLDISEQEHGMLAAFTYNTDLFDEATVAALARDYLALIEALAAQPDAALGALMRPLEAPAAARRPEAPAALTAPDGVLEQVLAAAREVLGAATLDPHAGFFAQGGTSLQALALVHRLNRQWSAQIPLQLLFLHQVMADFAQAIGPYSLQPD